MSASISERRLGHGLVRPARSLRAPMFVASLVFALVAPLTVDSLNTLHHRAFLDLLAYGNPYSLAPEVEVAYRGQVLPLDWPYPPLTILLVLPAWLAYQVTGSEPVYQFVFKLPLFASVAMSAVLLHRLANLWKMRPAIIYWLLFNPAVLLLVTASGGFDAVTMLLITGCYYFLAASPRPWASAALLGLAVALRMYPVVLLPATAIWLWQRWGSRSAMVYCAVAISVALGGTIPIFWDLPGYLSTTGMAQRLGPFSLSVLPVLGLYQMERLLRIDLPLADVVFQTLRGATLLALAMVYATAARWKLGLLPAMLATLLVFYALYPTMHALYILALLPLALLPAGRLVRWVWVPGFAWYLLFNGAFGSFGLPYFVAPLTGGWVDTYQALGLSEAYRNGIWGYLELLHVVVALLALRYMLLRPAADPVAAGGEP